MKCSNLKTTRTEVFLIKKAYELMGERLHWDSDKVRHLMRTVNVDTDILSAYLMVTPRQFQTWMTDNRFPKPVRLLLHQFAVNRGFYTPWPQAPSNDD